MLKFRKILRESLIAKFLIQLFVFNFFTCQCFATMPAEILADNFSGNMRSLFASFDEAKDHLNVVLNKTKDKFRLQLLKTNDFGEVSKKELFSQLKKGENESFIDFGYGFRFGLDNGRLRLGEIFNDHCEYFETDMDLTIARLNLNHNFSIAAKGIDVHNGLLSSHYLMLRGSELFNDGLIYSPFLRFNFNNMGNEGSIFGGKELTIETDILENKNEALIRGNGLSKIVARNQILNENSAILGNDLQIYASEVKDIDNAEIRSKNFKFFGDRIEVDESSRLEIENKSEINEIVFENRSEEVSLGKDVSVFTNIFLNTGNINVGKADILVESEDEKGIVVRGYRHSVVDQTLGSFINLGEISGERLLVDADGHLYNRKRIKAKNQLKLKTRKRLINEGEILQEKRNGLESSLESKKTINKKGKIELANNLLMKSENSIDNTEGKIKARRIKMNIGLGKDGEFLDNKVEKSASQTEENKHSEKVRQYRKQRRTVAVGEDYKESERQEEDSKKKGDNDSSEQNGKKEESVEIGYLVNSQGKIEATRDIEIKGSGAIYNADNGEISSRDEMSIDIYGRLLNQLGSKISTRKAEIKSASRIFNTGGSKIEGDITYSCAGFTNGIGSKIEGASVINSHRSDSTKGYIFNFGEIISSIDNIKLSADESLKNYGSILSGKSVELAISDEVVNSGKISSKGIDLSKVKRVFNQQGGVLEAREQDVIFKDKVHLSNEGRISSNNLILKNLRLKALDEGVENTGIIDVKDTLEVSSNDPLVNINGIWKAKRFKYKNNSRGTTDLSDLLGGTEGKLIVDNAEFSFARGRLENKEDTILDFNTKIFANDFLNLALLHGNYDLTIQSKQNIENEFREPIEDEFGKPIENEFKAPYDTVFPLTNDWDLDHNPKLKSKLGDIDVGLSSETKKGKGVISSGGDMTLSAGESIKNIGTIQTKKHLKINGKNLQHGWAKEMVRHESLPELEFDYDYMKSQPSYIKAGQGANIEVDKFLNTFGSMDIKGGLTSNNKELFLNYAGNINVEGDSKVSSSVFANMLGTVKTNRADKRYWSLEFCNTDSAVFNVLGGKLNIDSPYAINSGSDLYASEGVFLQGQPSDKLDSISEINIQSSGFQYTRMYSINEYNYGKYKDRILGMSMASLGQGAIIRADLNEKVKKRILPASISSSKQVIIDGYKDLKSNGIIHGAHVGISTGDGVTELGDTGDAIFSSPSELAKNIELYPYILGLVEEQIFDIADEGDFLFKSEGSDLKIPFTIIEDGTTDLKSLKLPFSLDVLKIMMLKQTQKVLGTGYLPDMPSFLRAAEISYDQGQKKEQSDNFPFLSSYTSQDIAVTSDKEAKHGLFFVPKKLGGYTLLFPEIRLTAKSVHATLKNPAGATVAQGDQDANVVIDTEGFLHATASLHADDNIKVKAGRGALFETTTYDEMAITQNVVAQTRRGFCGIGGGTSYHKLSWWHQIKRAREPMFATTTRGDFIVILPDENETAEYKGVFADIGGNFEMYGGHHELSPLELANIVQCPKLFKGGFFGFGGGANRVSTKVPVFLKTQLKSSGDFITDVRVFKNTGSEIEAVGDVSIKATDRIEFDTQTRKFVLTEGMEVDEGTFTTKVSSRKVEDVVFNQPGIKAGGNVKFDAEEVHLTGNHESEKDIKIKANRATVESSLAYGTDEFHSEASNMLSEASYDRYATFARVAPTVFRSKGDFIVDVLDEYAEHSINKFCRNEKIEASSIDSAPLRAHETVTEYSESSGFNFFMPTSVVAPVCDGNVQEAMDSFWKQSSLVNATNSLIHSRRGADIAANGIATALSAYSSIKTVLDFGVGGVASLFGVGSFGFYATETSRRTDHEFTIGSMTIAEKNIDWKAKKGDIKIQHRLAKAGGNQSYTVAGRIEVKPGEDIVTTDQETTSVNGSFNVFTMDASVGVNGGNAHKRSEEYQAIKFESKGENVFRAGKDIHIVIPQIEGKRNTFDAVLVNLENKANVVETRSNSYGVTLSTNMAEAAARTLGANIGMGNSRDEYLNEAYIRGATNFAHSKVKNQGCLVMDIENAGASYQYVPMEEVHESENFAIGFSGLDLTSTDAFAYSLGRSIAASAASMGVGMLASEAGLGGFVSTIAATLAGSYVNAELMPQAKVEVPEDEKRKLPKITTNSSVSYDRNGRGFRAENLDFNKEEVEQLIHDVKTKIFGDALDRKLSTEDAVKEVQKVEKETREFLEKEEVKETVKELKKINSELKKVEEKQKKLEEETPELKGNGTTEQPKTAEMGAPELQTSAETISPDNKINGLDEKKVEEYQQVLNEKNILAKKALDLGVSLKDRIDSFATDHGWNSSVKNVLIKGLQAIGIGAALGAATAVAAEAGFLTGLAAGVGIFAAGDAVAEATKFGTEAAVVYAISQADTEEEAQSYADLVMSMVEWGMIGLSAVGAYKGVKGKVPALRNTFSKAKIAELFGLSRAKRAATTASTSGTNSTKAPTRLDVIPETEMVQKAATMPGEWKGQFKVLKEGSEALTGTEFSLNVYSKQVLFKDPKTGQMFRVFQRNDIDPNYVVKSGPDAGRINSSLLKEGRAPYTSGDEQVIIHHMGQDAFGPFVEVTKTTHKSALHNQFGYGQKHPSNPVIRSKFNPVRKAYWRAYGEQFK